MRIHHHLSWLTLILFLAGTATAVAEVPKRLHYQGYLSNANGDPIDCPDAFSCPDQQFNITFRLYTDEQGGAAVWEETHTAVSITKGVFNVVMGTQKAIDSELVEGGKIYLGLSINGSDELAPRQKMVSAAFAIHSEHATTATQAENAQTLAGKPASEYVTEKTFTKTIETNKYTDKDVEQVLATKGYCEAPCYGDTDVKDLLKDTGYTPFSGNYKDLSNTPDLSGFCQLPCYGNEQVAEYLANKGYVPGPHLSTKDVEELLKDKGFVPGAPYGDAQVQAFLDAMGYVSGPHYSDVKNQAYLDKQGYVTGSHYNNAKAQAYLDDQGYVAGGHYNNNKVQAYLDDQGYASGPHYTDNKVFAYLEANGYVSGAHFSGKWQDIKGKPSVLTKLSVDDQTAFNFLGNPVISAAGKWIGDPSGLKGPKGDKGDPFNVDATGSDKSKYDAYEKGYSFLDLDDGNLYIKQSNASGDWSNPIPFGKGDKGGNGKGGKEDKGDIGLEGKADNAK